MILSERCRTMAKNLTAVWEGLENVLSQSSKTLVEAAAEIERLTADLAKVRADYQTYVDGVDHAMDGEVKRLQGIVAKLPMTADGVPVVPGTELWTMEPISEANLRPPYMIKVAHVWEPNGSADIGERKGFGEVANKTHACKCYSTREAARDAKEQGHE